MFTHKHYVPILKAKGGEFWALGRLHNQSHQSLTPLIELLPPRKSKKTGKTPELSKHIEQTCKDFRGIWNSTDRVFVDAIHLRDEYASTALGRFCVKARPQSLNTVPVTSIGRPRDYQTAVKKIVSQDKRGFLVRLGVKDFRDRAILGTALNNLLAFIGAEPQDVDILLDYSARQEASEMLQLMRLHIPQLPRLKEWRTLTAASGSMPKSLKYIADAAWHSLPREEWRSWIAITKTPDLERIPAYSDYVTRDPSVPSEGGIPSPNLRYTANKDYLVCVEEHRKNAAERMAEICRSLVTRQEFCGEDFSDGDREIAAVAKLATNSDLLHTSAGGPQQWTEWCLSHHFEFVVKQLQKEVSP